ncbi:hypothetical protein AJ79_09321 [Helicocarpus griseus UAMH5409]|uniref:Uncharacterized protein n=1 Tax=Helicocarpus griseus UAMH5409 TaxID=1447875 RepID=A0A2B7WKL8_9EURO|nr:hypothetical protein AJ79_09321 [Helicocarpus griseus UAMH5409]
MAQQSQSQHSIFSGLPSLQTQPISYAFGRNVPQSLYETCSEYAMCGTLKELLSRERTLQQQIDGLRHQTNQDRISLSNNRQICKNLQHQCQVLETTLEKCKRSEKEARDNLKAEREKTTVAERSCASLLAENETLWKFIEEVKVVSSNPANTSSTFQDIYCAKQISQMQSPPDDSTIFYDIDDNYNEINVMREDQQAEIELLS